MKVIRQKGKFTLLKKKDEYGRTVYWVDAIDDVSEYMDRFDCIDLIECGEHEFEDKCSLLF